MTAHVTNVAAIAEFRAALATFAMDVRHALETVELETQRAMDWITHDRPTYWRSEIRRSTDAVARAKDDIAQTRTFKRIGDYVPSCVEEKKALENAKKRMEHAERKLEIVKQWARTAQQGVDKFKGPVQRLTSVLDGDIPRAMALLDRMSEALANYAATNAPTAVTWDELVGDQSKQSIARPADELENASAGAETPSAIQSAPNTEIAAS